MPMAVLEAAACARPCLVSPAANPGGLVERCGAGIEVQPDAASIADGLARLARLSEAELRAMGVNARAMVAREFSWPRTAGIIMEAYERYARPRR
jgi:glycosyltransferase involved in cell wall biosynthesis